MIKTILVPVDFSANSMNAAEYAADFAKITGARLILFHAYDIPVSERKVASPIITLEEVEQKICKTCEIFKEKLHEKVSPELEIEYAYKKGDAVEEINKFAKESDAALIIMGIVGMSKLDELLIGSVASATMRTSVIPVLLVPGSAQFKTIQNIVFALDTNHISGSQGLSLLKEIANQFKAKMLVLNIMDENGSDSEIKSKPVNLPAIFVNDMNYSISFNEGENVVEGIHKFAVENHADLVAMIPHKHSLFNRLFQKSTTQELAFHTNIPLLAIPE